LQGCKPRKNLGVTYHASESAKECEGVNFHTRKWTPILGIRVPMGSQLFRGQNVGVKTLWIEELFISLESH